MDKEYYLVIKPFRGSPDGARVFDYEVNDIVPVPNLPFSDSLATVALREKWVKKYDPAKAERQAKAARRKAEEKAEKEKAKAAPWPGHENDEPGQDEEQDAAEQATSERLDRIADAIGQLDTAHDAALWTEAGPPRVDALEDILGHDITEAERDEAWAVYQANNAE